MRVSLAHAWHRQPSGPRKIEQVLGSGNGDEIVEKLCTEIAVIHRGRIVARGNTNELRSSAGAASSLEDFFLDLVGESAGSGRRPSWLG